MNYLAHLFCSPASPDSQLGNFIADFVKGRVDGRFPRAVEEGIRDHRTADLFTDSHEIFSASRRLISRERRRFSGVIIDVLYDHFLTTGWDRYSSVGLDEFVGTVYENLGRHEAPLPHPVRLVIERMIREDWLRSYGTVDGLDRTFWRISRRLSRENTLGSAVVELEANYSALHGHFHRFFPRLLAHVKPAHPG
jgi:acyl carrier protein phosphodiesterase